MCSAPHYNRVGPGRGYRGALASDSKQPATSLQGPKKPDVVASGFSDPKCFCESVGHQNRINHMNDAVRLEHVGDGDQRGAALFIFQHDVLAIMQ